MSAILFSPLCVNRPKQTDNVAEWFYVHDFEITLGFIFLAYLDFLIGHFWLAV